VSLTEDLRAALVARAERLRAEQAAAQVELTHDPALDEESDRIYETARIETEAELRSAQLTAQTLVELFLRAGPHARSLALTALTASLNIPTHEERAELSEVGDVQLQRCSHLVTDMRLICAAPYCLEEVELPDRARAQVLEMSRSGPLDTLSRAELGADELIDQLLARHAQHLRSGTVPPAPRSRRPVGTAPATGTLQAKLADMLREVPDR
jgi:hypothetical protein